MFWNQIVLVPHLLSCKSNFKCCASTNFKLLSYISSYMTTFLTTNLYPSFNSGYVFLFYHNLVYLFSCPHPLFFIPLYICLISSHFFSVSLSRFFFMLLTPPFILLPSLSPFSFLSSSSLFLSFFFTFLCLPPSFLSPLFPFRPFFYLLPHIFLSSISSTLL